MPRCLVGLACLVLVPGCAAGPHERDARVVEECPHPCTNSDAPPTAVYGAAYQLFASLPPCCPAERKKQAPSTQHNQSPVFVD